MRDDGFYLVSTKSLARNPVQTYMQVTSEYSYFIIYEIAGLLLPYSVYGPRVCARSNKQIKRALRQTNLSD